MKKKKTKRFREITKILLKHKVQKDFSPHNIRVTVEELGPTYIKIAQILSTREDLIPKSYCDEFCKLKENVAPLEYETVLQVIEEELGKKPEEVFSCIKEKPLGSASIGQVHKAKLLDGADVVIKVMRPGIHEKVEQDFAMLKKALMYCNIFTLVDPSLNLTAILDETFSAMKLEMDFNNELANMELFHENNKSYKYIKLPKTYKEYTTSKVLVMEYIDGIKIDDIKELEKSGYDLKEICAKLVENFTVQVIDHGVFHADPHNGNVMVENGKIVWIDLGMIGLINSKDRMLYKRIISAFVKNDVYELKNVMLTMGVCRFEINHSKLYQDIEKMLNKYAYMNVKDMNMAEIFEDLMTIARSNGIILPEGVTLLARSIIIIQNTIAKLDPTSNLLQFFGNHATDIYKTDIDLKRETLEKVQKITKGASKLIDIPSQIGDLLDITVKGQKHLNVEVVNLRENVNKASRMANRLILGLILSSFVIIFGIISAVIIIKANEAWMTAISIISLVTIIPTILFLIITLFIMMIRERKK